MRGTPDSFSMRRVVAVLLLPLASTLFTEDFATFIEDNYGEHFLDLLQRKDLGEKGSFGGKGTIDEELFHDPVIFVHGVSDTAGEKMKEVAEKFIQIGYVEGELYSTTYAQGARGNPISWTQYSMRCEYVKQIRALILAVRYYTGKDVDIVAYSLGVPIARKAILGGFCVDTDEELGGPLTKYIDSFVGIAGPNHGVALKVVGFPIPACVLGAPPICDRVVGLYSGLCPFESMFLNDINKKEHYEARHVYSIYSQSDHMVGYKVCGKITSTIPGEDGHKVFPNFDHDEVLQNAVETVFTVIQNHTTLPQFRRPLGPMTASRLSRRQELLELKTVVKSAKNSSNTERTNVVNTFPSISTSGADVVRSLEAIFTDTKDNSLQSIRNFFRQKFADEELQKSKNSEYNEGSLSARTESPRGRPVPDPKITEPKAGESDLTGGNLAPDYNKINLINAQKAKIVGSETSVSGRESAENSSFSDSKISTKDESTLEVKNTSSGSDKSAVQQKSSEESSNINGNMDKVDKVYGLTSSVGKPSREDDGSLEEINEMVKPRTGQETTNGGDKIRSGVTIYNTIYNEYGIGKRNEDRDLISKELEAPHPVSTVFKELGRSWYDSSSNASKEDQDKWKKSTKVEPSFKSHESNEGAEKSAQEGSLEEWNTENQQGSESSSNFISSQKSQETRERSEETSESKKTWKSWQVEKTNSGNWERPNTLQTSKKTSETSGKWNKWSTEQAKNESWAHSHSVSVKTQENRSKFDEKGPWKWENGKWIRTEVGPLASDSRRGNGFERNDIKRENFGSSQVPPREEGYGYLTRVRFQFKGCCD